MKGYKW